MLGTVFLVTLAPALAMVAGAVVATVRKPSRRVASAIQHFAAGVVFAALAGEVLPSVMKRDAPVAATAGFAIGVATMLGMRTLACRFGEHGHGEGRRRQDDAGALRGALGMILVIGLDILIDGVLIGVAFALGQKQGVLVAVALAVELVSLGLATAASLTGQGGSRMLAIGTCTALAVLPLAGATAGNALLGGLSGGWMEAVLAFAAATLLYLVTEELLVEAHDVPEVPWMTAMFFVGFLIPVLMDMLT